MVHKQKDQQEILVKLGISKLNPMQLEAITTIGTSEATVLLSPTGTGKTLAFLLPIIADLDPILDEIQALIIVPARELAIQIEQVIREMGSGFKTNAVYGGRPGSKDRTELKHPPAILIGTPGRIADHIANSVVSTQHIKTLVLDEFDKSLEIGFEDEMREIIEQLTALEKKILTSATKKVKIPSFMGLINPIELNYLNTAVSSNLKISMVISPTSNKLATLEQLIKHVGTGNGIIFCNLKESIEKISNFFYTKNISHDCFYGGLEQTDRERALIKFRNGTHQILIATDLAARGIDVPELDFIIHYELPSRKDEFTHRNGRTARMNANGTAYVLKSKQEELPDFIEKTERITLNPGKETLSPKWKTLYITGGRKDKISKGDIAGLFFKQGKLKKDEVGIIDLKQDFSCVAVPAEKVQGLIKLLNNSKLKKKKVRISLLN